MFAGRIGAIVYAKRRNQKKGPRRRMSDLELDRCKAGNCIHCPYNYYCLATDITDRDIVENTVSKIKFRKIPYAAWIMGLIFWAGAFFTIYLIFEELI